MVWERVGPDRSADGRRTVEASGSRPCPKRVVDGCAPAASVSRSNSNKNPSPELSELIRGGAERSDSRACSRRNGRGERRVDGRREPNSGPPGCIRHATRVGGTGVGRCHRTPTRKASDLGNPSYALTEYKTTRLRIQFGSGSDPVRFRFPVHDEPRCVFRRFNGGPEVPGTPREPRRRWQDRSRQSPSPRSRRPTRASSPRDRRRHSGHRATRRRTFPFR